MEKTGESYKLKPEKRRDLFGEPIDEPESDWRTNLLDYQKLKVVAYICLMFDVMGFFGSLYSPAKWLGLFFLGNIYFLLAYMKSREILEKYIKDQL